MRFRGAGLALIVLALVPGCIGISVIARGLLDPSDDNALWNYLAFGGALLSIAVVLVVVAVRDARR